LKLGKPRKRARGIVWILYARTAIQSRSKSRDDVARIPRPEVSARRVNVDPSLDPRGSRSVSTPVVSDRPAIDAISATRSGFVTPRRELVTTELKRIGAVPPRNAPTKVDPDRGDSTQRPSNAESGVTSSRVDQCECRLNARPTSRQRNGNSERRCAGVGCDVDLMCDAEILDPIPSSEVEHLARSQHEVPLQSRGRDT
jgi:hypothetical protein